jgi:hypothetical protein
MRLRTAILALACAAACQADTLTLRNGQVVQGTYMGGTARTVKMQVEDTVKTYDVADIATLQFTPPVPTASAKPGKAKIGCPTAAAIMIGELQTRLPCNPATSLFSCDNAPTATGTRWTP